MNTQQVLQANEQALATLRATFDGIATDITLSRYDWRALMESGALASLHVERYHGIKALTAIDLGLDEAEVKEVSNLVNLGHRLLLPKEVLNAFNSVETRARQVLRRYCLSTPIGTFLPARAYDGASKAMQESKAKFADLVANLLVDLPSHRDTIEQSYYDLARQVWERIGYKGSQSSWDFRDDFVARCMAQFPTREELESAFKFELRLDFVPMPYTDNAQAQPSYAGASDDLLTMRRAVIEQAQQARQELVSGFVASVQSELYTLVNDALGDVLESIKSNGSLHSRSVAQLKGIVERIGDLNFWQDRKLETIQGEILKMCDTPSERRDLSLNTDILRELALQCRMVLSKVATVERGAIEVKQESQPSVTLDKGSDVRYNLPSKPSKLALGSGRSSGKLF